MRIAIQVDDQQWSSPLPVVMCTMAAHRSASPALEFTMLVETAAAGGRRRMPYLTLDVPQRLQLAVWETAAWRAFELYRALPLDVLSSSGAAANAADAPAAKPAVDALLVISLLALSEVEGTLFFRAAPAARPRDTQAVISAAALNMVPEALDSVRLKLQGREISGVSMRASQLQTVMQQQLRSEIFNIGFSLLYSYLGYFGTSAVSQGLSVVGQGLRKVAGDVRRDAGAGAPIAGISEGVQQGAGRAVEGIFRGIQGVYKRPMAGAAKSGAGGFVKGLGQGIAGVIVQPLAGAMDLGASAMQGVNASLTSALSSSRACAVERVRVQRALAPSGGVAPFDVGRALGHALLQLSMLAPENVKGRAGLFGNASRRKQRARESAASITDAHRLDRYFLVPNSRVALLTNQCIMVLSAPQFADVAQVAQETGMVLTEGLIAGARRQLPCAICHRYVFRQAEQRPDKLIRAPCRYRCAMMSVMN
jgi:hypothetical protein